MNDMKQLIFDFPKHISANTLLENKPKIQGEIRNVVILGMGGSGIGGRIVNSIVAGKCTVPVIIINNYKVRGFINEHTLAIASSYSGNTEETIEAMKAARDKGAKVVCVTSAGKLSEMAQAEKMAWVKLPSGYDAPRACLAFSMKALLTIFTECGLIEDEFLKNLEDVPSFLEKHQAEIYAQAQELAEKTKGKFKILYAENDFEAVMVRWKQQLNENAKELAIHNVVPEMNHNEIVGWESVNRDKIVLYIRNELDLPRNQKRMDIMREIIAPNANDIIDVPTKGDTFLKRLFYTIHLGDFYSLVLAEMNEVNVMEVQSIMKLKQELASVK